MSDEQYSSYEVPIWQAGWAKSMLNDAGIPIVGTSRQGNMVVIIIPAQSAGFDHRAAYKPRRRPWWVPSRKTIITVAMVAVVGVGAYMVLSGGVKITGVTMPAMPTLPAVAVTNPVAQIDTTANSVSKAADAAKGAAMAVVYAVVALLVVVALWFLRGPLSAVVHGLGGVVGALKGMVKRG